MRLGRDSPQTRRRRYLILTEVAPSIVEQKRRVGWKRITVCHNYANVKCVTRNQN